MDDPQLSRRLFPDNGDGATWSSESSRASNNITVALMDLLALLEQDGPVDLQDFHFLISHSLSAFVSGLSITRRMGHPADPPDPIVRSYPRLECDKS